MGRTLHVPSRFPMGRLPRVSVLDCTLFVRSFSFLGYEGLRSIRVFFTLGHGGETVLPVLQRGDSVMLTLWVSSEGNIARISRRQIGHLNRFGDFVREMVRRLFTLRTSSTIVLTLLRRTRNVMTRYEDIRAIARDKEAATLSVTRGNNTKISTNTYLGLIYSFLYVTSALNGSGGRIALTNLLDLDSLVRGVALRIGFLLQR